MWEGLVAITGAHVIVYSSDADADRAFSATSSACHASCRIAATEVFVRWTSRLTDPGNG